MPHDPSPLALLTDWSPAIRPRARLGHTIEVHETIGSTNDRARELLAEDGGDGSVVLAEVQTAGRGRRGRTWFSPPGVNLTLSVAVQPAIRAADVWQLGLATALATREACARIPGVEPGLKWPNDVVSGDGRKVAGLLLETVTSGRRLTGAVLGIGINVNWLPDDMPEDISERATSLASLAGREIDRVPLLGDLLDALDEEVAALEAGRSPLTRYRRACVTLGAEVTVDTAGATVQGRAVALDEIGGLVVETDAGRTTVSSGEVVYVRGDAR